MNPPELMTLDDAAALATAIPIAGAEAAPPSIREKLSKVAAHCAYVRKGGVNLFHKYNYATAADVFEKVSEALATNRLVSCPVLFLEGVKERTNAKGGTEYIATVRCCLEILDLDSEQAICSTAFGSGQDNGDKAVMKAQTAALKYAWMMLLNISTGDDPDDDAKVDSRMAGEPITKPQTKEQYDAKVERNKDDRNYSAAAVDLSNQLNEELSAEGVKPQWPGEDVETCRCGSKLIRKTTSKAKGSRAYVTCDLSDRAFRRDEGAMAEMNQLAMENVCGAKEHTWRWA